jgi:CheY-like chemotaxis protein
MTPPRVLVIDDESDICDGVSRWLDACGYETCSAQDGKMGVAAANENLPDAIILDMLMPKMDGMETLTTLHASEQTREIPVVMLSASLRDEQRALEAGATFFIHKPYDGKKLVGAVQAAIHQR